MSTLHNTGLPHSLHGAWEALSKVHPRIWKTFLLLILPFSLIAPLMLAYAGSHHAAEYLIDAPLRRWESVAAAFLIAELCTVPLMAAAIKIIAAAHAIEADYKDTLLLAAISALPMWLSALALAIPNLIVTLAILVLGLLSAPLLLEHGSRSILHIDEPVQAQSLAFQTFALGALVWVVLGAIVVLPLLA